MLYAISHNKSGLIKVGEHKIPVRQLFREREDMLTAAIFSRLLYLSPPVLDQLFSEILPDSDLSFKGLDDIEYWPIFDSTIQNRVEPDVILKFDWGVMVVEVKRPSDGKQCRKQWYRELEALPPEYCDGEIVFLALGGNSRHNQAMISKLRQDLNDKPMFDSLPQLFEIDWKRFGHVLYGLTQNEQHVSLRSDSAVLGDLLNALTLYRVKYREYHLGDLKKLSYSPLGDVNAIGEWPNIKPKNQLRCKNIDWQLLANTELHIEQPLQAIRLLGAKYTEEQE